MSKLVAFFEKKKKKPLKSSLCAALDEKPKEEEDLPLEVGASVILPEGQDGGNWIVEPEVPPPQEGSTTTEGCASASWLKVSAVSAASVRKKEALPTWNACAAAAAAGTAEGEGGAAAGGGEREGGSEGGAARDALEGRGVSEEERAAGGEAAGAQETGRGLRGLDALLNSSPSAVADAAAAGKKWVPPSLRARMAGGSGMGGSLSRGGSSSKPNFEGDQDLTTVAQLGLYRTPGSSMQDAAAAMRKKKQQQGENSPAPNGVSGEEAASAEASGADKKKKKKKGGGGAAPAEDTGPEGADDGATGATAGAPQDTGAAATTVEIFNVWKYIQLEPGAINTCSAAQNNELVRQKYIQRTRWGEDVTNLKAQPVS